MRFPVREPFLKILRFPIEGELFLKKLRFPIGGPVRGFLSEDRCDFLSENRCGFQSEDRCSCNNVPGTVPTPTIIVEKNKTYARIFFQTNNTSRQEKTRPHK